ncbi:hypothetical protein GCM10007052_14970 [Halioglobus japonicus]|nr:hypothetical protein [Halioglobus japonicus]GHD13155.1 hypothetical protein GCM10007052_14970 [Halioglobus japonicus]
MLIYTAGKRNSIFCSSRLISQISQISQIAQISQRKKCAAIGNTGNALSVTAGTCKCDFDTADQLTRYQFTGNRATANRNEGIAAAFPVLVSGFSCELFTCAALSDNKPDRITVS